MSDPRLTAAQRDEQINDLLSRGMLNQDEVAAIRLLRIHAEAAEREISRLTAENAALREERDRQRTAPEIVGEFQDALSGVIETDKGWSSTLADVVSTHQRIATRLERELAEARAEIAKWERWANMKLNSKGRMVHLCSSAEGRDE